MLNRMTVNLHVHDVDYDTAHRVMMRLFKMGYNVSIHTVTHNIKLIAERIAMTTLQADIATVVGTLKYDAHVDYFEITDEGDITRYYHWTNTTDTADTTPSSVYLVTLNTEAAVSETLYPMCADYTPKEAEDIIRRVDAVSSVVHVDGTIVVQYTAKTLPSALKIALGISNTLLQDCVAVRIRDSQDNIVLETLCGLNTAPYGEFNSDYFKD